MKLSIIVPVYNEEKTLLKLVEKVRSIQLKNFKKEIILVDDFSKDGSREIISKIKFKDIKKAFNKKNMGKGGAIKEGLKHATGDLVIFQDADLEYDPNDYSRLLAPFSNKKIGFVLGQRKFPKFFSKENYVPSHWLGNFLLRIVGNLLYSKDLKDYEPCYKVFRREVLNSTPVISNRFEYDIELMCRLFKKNIKYALVPISYKPRPFSEGKKIKWTDGFHAIYTMIYYRLKS